MATFIISTDLLTIDNGSQTIRVFFTSDASTIDVSTHDQIESTVVDLTSPQKSIEIRFNANTTVRDITLIVRMTANFSDGSDPIVRDLPFRQSGVDLPTNYPDDPTSVFLSDVIDNIMVQALPDDSFLSGINRFHAVLLAKRIMQDLNYDVMREVRVYEAPITSTNKVIPPIDFVDYIRLSYVTSRGMLIPIFTNKKLSISFNYVRESDGEIVVDSNGYPLQVDGSRRTEDDIFFRNNRRFNVFLPTYDTEYIYDNALYGITGGQCSYTGDYRYDPANREFLLDNVPEDFTSVVIEYISDPILAERDPTLIRIHKYFQSALEAGIYYLYIDKLRNVPRVEKEAARREYYNEIRKSRRRMFTKPQELIQKLGSDIGFDKML